MEITIDPSFGPTYRQIAEKIRSMILDGELPPGACLPSVRALSTMVGTSTLTVHCAYKLLADLGLVESQPRQATRVIRRIAGDSGRIMLDRLPNYGPLSSFEVVAQSSGIRSMASSIGDPSLFYSQDLLTEFHQLRSGDPWDFYYSNPAGAPELLEQVARLLCQDRIACNESDLVITDGSMQGISLLLDIATRPGDSVLVQEPGRLWLKELLLSHRLTAIPIRSGTDPIDLDHVGRCIEQHRPTAMILSPDFGHATGLVMSERDRLDCIRLARDNDVLIIEDGATRPLRFGARSEMALTALDSTTCAYVGSFSYSLCPGVRTGFLRLSTKLRLPAITVAQAKGQGGSRFLQLCLARYLGSGAYESHLARILPRYRARKDAMLSALATAMPRSITWTKPQGGLSTWVGLSPGTSASELYARAIKLGITFAPGQLFLTAGDPQRYLRLSYGMLEPAELREATRVLAKIVSSPT